ncbi:hypothetical protein BDW66DRAFT_158685 [Aspergillus desertorum]
MHAEQDYTTFYPCSELPFRGYTALCLNNAQSKTGLMNDLDFETMMSDVSTGVQFLKAMGNIDKVVLWGHSGDARGRSPLIDANYGLSTMTSLSLNPAITNSSEAVNLYSPANGWTASGANYTTSFVKEFYAAVASRWNDIIHSAVQRNKLIQSGNATYTDDEGLVITDANYIGLNNKIISQDTRILSHTTYEWPLLHKGIPSDTTSFYDGALKTTSLTLTADNIAGDDWVFSQTAPIASAAGISVPSLTMGNTGHYEYLNAEKIYLAATKAKDKSIAFVEGAQHTINTCTECERYPGEFGDTVRTAFDYMDAWLGEPGRFVSA